MIETPPPGSAQKNTFTTLPPSSNKPLNRTGLIIIVVIAVAVLLIFCCCPVLVGAISSSRSTPTPNPAGSAKQTQITENTVPTQDGDAIIPTAPASSKPTATQRPENTSVAALGLSLTQFMNKYNNLTDIQKKDFIPESTGKSVNWSGKIDNVASDGSITIDIPNTLASSVSLKGVSPAEAKKLSKGQMLHFTGTITSIIDFLGMHITVEDVQLSDTPQPTDEAAHSSSQPTQQQASNIISPGTYLVGTDIKPGIYRGDAGGGTLDSCYWARLKDMSGNLDSLLANENAIGQFYVEVKATDKAIETRCSLIPLESVPPVTDLPQTIAAGVYLVGRDIKVGTYKGQAGSDVTDSCYWARLNSVAGGLDAVIANDNATGQFYIQVSQGDFALSTACELTLVQQ